MAKIQEVVETEEVNGVWTPVEPRASSSPKATPARSRRVSARPTSSPSPATAATLANSPLCVVCKQPADGGLRHVFGITPLCSDHQGSVAPLVKAVTPKMRRKPAVQVDLGVLLFDGLGRLLFGR